jgi:DNA helicase-2/ATP-dependent DNA helicase PcrA
VALIRDLSLRRAQVGLYDFGLEVSTRSGLLPFYRLQNTPDAQSAVDNLEELLNSLQMFQEQVDAEIRNGEREEGDVATIEEWLQSLMLITDMDQKEGEEEQDNVTLMTVHSAKGLEYEYVYVVGCEENLFPSQRALETVEGIEEERRLFYVALTRAKSLATLSCVDMRFKWGNMEFSKPSRFLAEIDEQYVECDFSLRGKPRGEQSGTVKIVSGKDESALDALRRRFDVRYQQKTENGKRKTENFFKREEPVVRTPQRDVSGMRRVATSTVGQVTSEPCLYSVGERVEHPRFGRGEIVQVVPLATDHKLVVRFASGEEKTLLSKLAKLTKL